MRRPTCIFWADLTPFSLQLVRAGAAGVGRVVLTGCDMEGSRKGRAVAEWWLARRLELEAEGAAAPRLYFTAGVHPHDAKKIWDEAAGVVDVGINPTVASQYSSTIYTRFPIMLTSCLCEAAISFMPRWAPPRWWSWRRWPRRRSASRSARPGWTTTACSRRARCS